MTGLPKLELIQKDDHTRVHGVLVIGGRYAQVLVADRYVGYQCQHGPPLPQQNLSSQDRRTDRWEDNAIEVKRHWLT